MVKYLSEEDILKNKVRFISLLRGIKREGADIDALIKKLESGGFFEAPASSKYHSNFKGGLCYHSLNVYDTAVKINEAENLDYEESLLIVALLHDMSKMGFYEEYIQNKKQYSEGGFKYDSMGRFDWVSESAYKVKEASDRYIFGSHGQNSERMVSYFIPLNDSESAAIIWHMGGTDDFKCPDLSCIYNKYPLATILHTADFLSTYIDERV